MKESNSLQEFIEIIIGKTTRNHEVVTYRGHEDELYKLVPSILRDEKSAKNEHTLLRELEAAHPEDFHSDTTALAMLVRMQHHSLPTRLLDVTLNPLVALYFAAQWTKKQRSMARRNSVRTTAKGEADGEVIILTTPKDRIRYFDSDTVSCLANLAKLKWDLKTHLSDEIFLNHMIDDKYEYVEDAVLAFNQLEAVKRLLHFIRQEKNGFQPEIIPLDLIGTPLVKPKQNNRRILAQAGAFFIFGLLRGSDGMDSHVNVDRIRIKARAKADILRDLDKLGINEKTLFPDIEHAARYLTSSLSDESAESDLALKLRSVSAFAP